MELAENTESYFVEYPNRLLTVAVPTRFPDKTPRLRHGNSTYAFYHKTEWTTIPKILVEDLIRPADWSRDSEGVPQQFPCYGPFGASCETDKTSPSLTQHCATHLSNSLYKIGKGQLGAGILGYSQCNQMTRHQTGGNDQIQRGAMLNGGSKNDHATVARSDILTVAYVATTQVLPENQIYWIQRSAEDSSFMTVWCTCGFLISLIFSRNFTSALRRQPFWIVNTPVIVSSFRCNKTSLSLRKLP